jgi:FtsP/CotA-like multicopper oxidase with cupredoxin domain
VLNVEPRRYRFRILDANNFRGLQLKIVRNPTQRPGVIAVPTWAIAGDGGGLQPKAVNLQPLNQFIMMVTSERVEIVVDFTHEAVGNELFLINDAVTGDSSTPTNDVNNVGQIMKFKVVPLQGTDTSVPPDQLDLPARRTLAPVSETHRVSMNVLENQNAAGEQKRFQMGRVDPDGTNHLELWSDPISQFVKSGVTAAWEVWNFAGVGGGHAFHIHLIEFQITEREDLDANGKPSGVKHAPMPWELGEKDTAFAPRGQITRFIAPFDHVSKFIYHCHFIDHEDHEMMRFWRVV